MTLVSDLFEFSWRYQLPALVTLAPAGALGLSVLISAAADRRRPPEPGGIAAAAGPGPAAAASPPASTGAA